MLHEDEDEDAEFQPEQNEEQWEGDGETHECWTIYECPCPDSCSAQSFKHAKCWSFESAHKCLNYLVRHLVMSGNHTLTLEEAQYKAATVTPVHEVVMLEMVTKPRPEKRKGNQNVCYENNYGHGKGGKPCKRPRHGHSSSAWNSGWHPNPPADIVDLFSGPWHPNPPADIVDRGSPSVQYFQNQHAVVRHPPNPDDEGRMIQFRKSHVRLILDAIQRCANAVTQLRPIMHVFNEQYGHEEKVLKEAVNLLAGYLNTTQ